MYIFDTLYIKNDLYTQIYISKNAVLFSHSHCNANIKYRKLEPINVQVVTKIDPLELILYVKIRRKVVLRVRKRNRVIVS